MFLNKDNKQEPSSWDRVLHGEEIWNDPKIKKSIENHNGLVKKRNKLYNKC